ncbi:MAG TPA: hypothetical protein VJ984_05655 [Xanthomonadales bacterium]|nr:hypothetical protein [Xanthomonadales bacterium]
MNSSPVKSSQSGVHQRLDSVVLRHLKSDWRQPLHQPTINAFEKLLALPGFNAGRNLILDSGCGTGASTRLIAEQFPDSIVIGIDQSADRLSRLGFEEFPCSIGNTFWIRAELASFWRLALENGWQLERHYLLYPNPWPKPAHLSRRWHAHPVFPKMLRLGGQLELRCNWEVYADEFARAVELVCDNAEISRESARNEADWDAIKTPFGSKYGRSGHTLFRVQADLQPCSH